MLKSRYTFLSHQKRVRSCVLNSARACLLCTHHLRACPRPCVRVHCAYSCACERAAPPGPQTLVVGADGKGSAVREALEAWARQDARYTRARARTLARSLARSPARLRSQTYEYTA